MRWVGDDVYVRRSKEGVHRALADVDCDKMVAGRIRENGDARDCHGEAIRAFFFFFFFFFFCFSFGTGILR